MTAPCESSRRFNPRVTFHLKYEVIPGISSVQALAAKHRIALNRIGESIHITTGRKLAEGFPNNADSVVVLLDGEQSFKMIETRTSTSIGALMSARRTRFSCQAGCRMS